jgi:hypothetical protein
MREDEGRNEGRWRKKDDGGKIKEEKKEGEGRNENEGT